MNPNIIPIIGGGVTTAPTPQAFIQGGARDSIQTWRQRAGEVEAAITELVAAHDALEGRAGDRANEAREYLAAEIARLSAPLEAFKNWESTSADLAARLSETRERCAHADVAYQYADEATASRLKGELEAAEAALRGVYRECTASVEALRPPAIPDLEALKHARIQTDELIGAQKKKPMRRLHLALDQAMAPVGKPGSARPARKALSAKLWVVYEPAKAPKDLQAAFDARFARFLEA